MLKWLKYVFITVVLLGAFMSYYAYSLLFGPVAFEEKTLFIKRNTSYEELVITLNETDLIQNDKAFNLLASKMNLKNNIHSGKYVIPEGASLYDLLAILRGGLQTPVKLIINNVNFKGDLAARISQQIELDSARIYTFLTDESQLEALGYTKDNIMCLFIPNTYEVYWNISLEAFLEKIKTEHANFWNESRLAKAKALGLDEQKAFILASIVEKEYKFGEERSRIAGVYINRLNLGMKLQADPTVKFALGDLTLKRILTVHTEYDNPYNTYFNTGLPPGPICLPETSTIDAVLNAEEHEYLYFCAKEDLSGYHVFNTTYAAHLQTARLYQAALNKLKIYE